MTMLLWSWYQHDNNPWESWYGCHLIFRDWHVRKSIYVILYGLFMLPHHVNYLIMALGPISLKIFSIKIQLIWKLQFVLIQILIKWLLQNFAHGVKAMLSQHVQKIVVIIWLPVTESQSISQSILIVNKNCTGNGPLETSWQTVFQFIIEILWKFLMILLWFERSD